MDWLIIFPAMKFSSAKYKFFPWMESSLLLTHSEWACSRIALQEGILNCKSQHKENLPLHSIRPLRICIAISCVCEMIGLGVIAITSFIHCTILAAMHDLLSHNKERENCSFFMMHEIVLMCSWDYERSSDDDVGSIKVWDKFQGINR